MLKPDLIPEQKKTSLIKKAHLSATLHKFGNKAGKLLARLYKGPYSPTHINMLRDSSGKIDNTPHEVQRILHKFYTSLYAPDTVDHAKVRDFLHQSSLPKISQTHLEALNATIMPHLIHPAQSGFTKGRSASINIRKVLLAFEQSRLIPRGDLAILALDAEKEFDNVNINWLVEKSTGFSGAFLHLVQTMYASPSARLCVAGALTDKFLLHKGTR